MKRSKTLFIVAGIVCCVVAALAVMPLFHPGLFPTIDNISVIRLEAMADELLSGQFPVRYVSRLAREHGYSLFGYYGPLPFYTGALMHLVGVNLVGALKRSYLLAILMGAGGVFGLSYEFFGVFGAIISFAAYAFSPFVGYDVYWRGGLGEVWAMGFVPWILWYSYRAIRDASRRDAMLAAVSLAGLMLSHNLTAYMGVVFVALWMTAWIFRYKKGIPEALSVGVVGLGLSAFFWLPAFATRGLVWVSYLQADRRQIFESLLQGNLKEIFFPTFIPMITNWTAIILPFIAWWIVHKRTEGGAFRYAALVLGALFAFALFFMSGLSHWVWDVFYPVLYIFQFPWRFLTMMTIFGSVLTGGLVYAVKRRRLVLVLVAVFIIVWANFPNYRPRSYEFIDKYVPQDPCGTSWGFEYLPVWVKTCLKTPWQQPYRITSGDITVMSAEKKPYQITLEVEAIRESMVQIGQYAYPGWQATIDGVATPIIRDNEYGLIEVPVAPGKHAVSVVLRDTPVEKGSMAISIVAAGMIAVVAVREIYLMRRNRAHRQKKV